METYKITFEMRWVSKGAMHTGLTTVVRKAPSMADVETWANEWAIKYNETSAEIGSDYTADVFSIEISSQ